jgi:hypothetical protein
VTLFAFAIKPIREYLQTATWSVPEVAFVILSVAKNQVGRRGRSTCGIIVAKATMVLEIESIKHGRLILRYAQNDKGGALVARIQQFTNVL